MISSERDLHPSGAPLWRRVRGLFDGRLVRASLSLLAGTVAGGMMGYVFQVVMGRMLSPLEYGLFSAR
jgi:hypothetical protein